MKYYLVNAYELNNSAVVAVYGEADDNSLQKLHKNKSDSQVVISAGVLAELGKYAWIES